jgi:DNA-binding GntR family transcriptional regulator
MRGVCKLYTELNRNGIAQDTEAARLYASLRREILSGALAPGTPLAEIELARRFGASRTPLREALIRLEAEGLVRIEPRRGAFVQQMTVTDFLEINELRSVLEPYAARVASERIEPEVVTALQARLALIDPTHPGAEDHRQLERLDADVHMAIASASGNKRLARLIEGLDDMMEFMRVSDMRRRHHELHASLGAILTSLQAGNAVEAETLMRQHVSDFRGAIVNRG